MPRILLKVEYLGSRYHGWQRQADLPSIQETLENALLQFLQEPVMVTAAGRTDKGVHATGQIVHFDTTVIRAAHQYVFGLNHFLPEDIRILEAREVPNDFHARFSAIYRRYQMRILNRRVASGILMNQVLWHPIPLNETWMQQGADYLLGEHDFTSFRGRDCQARSPVKQLQFCEIIRQGDLININIQASGFLHNMEIGRAHV